MNQLPVASVTTRIVISLLLCFLSACNTTKGLGHMNPEFKGHRLAITAVYIDNLGEIGDALEESVVEQLKARGVEAKSVRTFARFAKDNNDFVKKVWALGVNDVLVIAMTDSRGTVLAGYQSWGQATTTGSATNLTVTTTPVGYVRRTMLTTSRIFNRSGDKLWEATTERTADGLAFTTDGRTLSETTNALLQALEKDGLVPSH